MVKSLKRGQREQGVACFKKIQILNICWSSSVADQEIGVGYSELGYFVFLCIILLVGLK